MNAMRLFYCLICIFCFCTSTVAQPYKMANRYDHEHPQTLYAHYYNLIYIGQKEINDSVDIPINHSASIYKYGERNSFYLVKPKKQKGNTFYLNINNKKVAFKFSISDEILLPKIKFSWKMGEGGSQRVDSIICIAPFKDTINNMKYPYYRIISYEVEIKRKGKVIYQGKSSGTQFSAAFKEKYMQSFMSDKVIVSNIVVQDRDGNTITVPKIESVIY